MAIQMKRTDNGDGSDNNSHNTLDSLNKKTEYSGSYEVENGLDSNDPENKFRGGLGDGKVDIDKVNDLPAYTAPPLVNPDKKPVGSGAKLTYRYYLQDMAFSCALHHWVCPGWQVLSGMRSVC